MQDLKQKISDLINSIDLEANPELTLTKSRLEMALASLGMSQKSKPNSTAKFGTKPPLFSTVKKNLEKPVVGVIKEEPILEAEEETPEITVDFQDIIQKSSPKSIVDQFPVSELKAKASELGINYNDSEDALMLANRIKKHFKTMKNEK